MPMPDPEALRIADQLKRAYDGPAWHGPALRELLAEVTEDQASHRPVPGAHSIQELVLHIAAWMRIARERLTATRNRDHPEEENGPPADTPGADALAGLEREQRALEEAIGAFPDSRLNDRAPATEPQTFY